MLFDEINTFVAKDVCEFILKANMLFEDNITLFVNSPGGICTDGFAIIDFMNASRIPIATRAVGEIASMGVSIFVSGSPGMRTMAPNTAVMTHQFSGGMYGKAHELLSVNKYHEKLHNIFVAHFVKNTKLTAKQVNDILLGPSDKYLDAKECLKYGICDRIAYPWDMEDEYPPIKAPKAPAAKASSIAKPKTGRSKA